MLFILAATASAAFAKDGVLISYEATPSAGFDLPGLKDASYSDRAAFSAKALEVIVPKILKAVDVDPALVSTEVTPGGYLLKTNASLQSQADLDDAQADRLAAALGYIFHQYSVLVSRLGDSSGSTGFVTVRFPENALDASVAQAFFEKAEATHKGLGGGYTAFGDEQIFLNVTDSAGKTYSGLDDTAFLDGLTRTAASFGAPAPEIATSGKASARFIDNDWKASPKGESYVERLGGADAPVVKALDAIAADYATLVAETAHSLGWH